MIFHAVELARLALEGEKKEGDKFSPSGSSSAGGEGRGS